MAYPAQLSHHRHNRTAVILPPAANSLPAASSPRSPRTAATLLQYSRSFDPARSAAEENSRQANPAPLSMPTYSPSSSPPEVAQSLQRPLPHGDPQECSSPQRVWVDVKREPFPSLSPSPPPCLALRMAPAPAPAPAPAAAPSPAGASPVGSQAGLFRANAVSSGVSEGSSSRTSSSSASSANEAFRPNPAISNRYTHPPSPSSGGSSPLPIVASAQRQHEFLLALERICTTAAATYWNSQYRAVVDQYGPPPAYLSRQPLHVDRYHGRDWAPHVDRLQPYTIPQRNYPNDPRSRHAPTHVIRRPHVLMDYIFLIARLVWGRAIRFGEPAEELEAVHRMGNLYAWGDKVVVATAAAGLAAREERLREWERERERIEVMRQWRRMLFALRGNENVVPSDLNAPTYTFTYVGQPAPEQSPGQVWVPMRSNDHETRTGVWAQSRREETFVRPRPQPLLLSPHVEEREVREEEEEEEEAGPAEGGILTEEMLQEVMMAGRDLVGWLLSEDAKRAVDELWAERRFV